jgi:hypothetical protein
LLEAGLEPEFSLCIATPPCKNRQLLPCLQYPLAKYRHGFQAKPSPTSEDDKEEVSCTMGEARLLLDLGWRLSSLLLLRKLAYVSE